MRIMQIIMSPSPLLAGTRRGLLYPPLIRYAIRKLDKGKSNLGFNNIIYFPKRIPLTELPHLSPFVSFPTDTIGSESLIKNLGDAINKERVKVFTIAQHTAINLSHHSEYLGTFLYEAFFIDQVSNASAIINLKTITLLHKI